MATPPRASSGGGGGGASVAAAAGDAAAAVEACLCGGAALADALTWMSGDAPVRALAMATRRDAHLSFGGVARNALKR
jgi:hypothetical protein